mmetsp:Transcript_4125/g.6981  ORF Transcript_4125/g.6981 Transcript_4125/m.6981 type:complete len:97 (+) Transcript_4125:363-653(+)
MLICCLRTPLTAAICGLFVAVGKVLYSIGYMRSGPKGRIVGAILVDIGLLVGLIGAIYSIVQLFKSEGQDIGRVFPISAQKYHELLSLHPITPVSE